MANYTKQFIVKPGAKVRLKHFDPDDSGKLPSAENARPDFEKYLASMDELQYLMYSENKHSLLIVLQGMDTAGKDGVIRHVMTAMNPQGCTVTRFVQPTEEEANHDFLWRIHPHVPRRGAVAVFNRSHYETVLVERVHKLAPKEVWSNRYDFINEFERLLIRENHTTILKFFLHISKKEQLSRFERRLKNPSRHWKISDSDYNDREFWDDYTRAYEDLLEKTSTDDAPWFIIPANHKWFRDLAIAQITTRAMTNLKMKEPAPTVDIDKIRRQFHEASARADSSSKK
jgi:PPK2 family polyphosphate:nucleotide phosphotransferase